MGVLFIEGCENVHDDLWIGRLSVLNEDLVHAVEERLERTDNSPLRHFPCIFLKFHCYFSTKFFLIILSFRNCVHAGCQRCFWKNTERQASTFDFLTQYSEEGKNILSHVVTENKTWVSHEAPKLKQQSMEWRHTSSPNKDEIQADHFNSEGHVHNVLGQKRRSACGLLTLRLHNQRRCLLRHTSKIATRDPE